MARGTGAAYLIGASGVGRAAAGLLVSKRAGAIAWAGQVNVTFWDSQRQTLKDAIDKLGQIDLVLPIAGVGERQWLPKSSKAKGFCKPDLAMWQVNETGVFYAVALAVQYFRWMREEDPSFRGEILTVASICGFYIQPTTPMYTASKQWVFLIPKPPAKDPHDGTSSAIAGFVRSYGKLLEKENIRLSAICPDKVLTNIAKFSVHDIAEARGVLIPMPRLMESFEMLLPGGKHHEMSYGECLEVADKPGPQEIETRLVPVTPFFNEASKRSSELSEEIERDGLRCGNSLKQ